MVKRPPAGCLLAATHPDYVRTKEKKSKTKEKKFRQAFGPFLICAFICM
jgi:hypothetical protein